MDEIKTNDAARITEDAAGRNRDSVLMDLAMLSVFKQPCLLATTANVTIATALAVGQTLDGVVITPGIRVLVKNQTDKKQNGIYVVLPTEIIRASDFDTGAEIAGAFIPVLAGTANAMKLFQCTSISATIGTSDIDIAARAFA